MANDKTFTVAGISNLKGVYKARFANDITRIKVLDKNEHTDIRLIELGSEMTKEDAASYLLTVHLEHPEITQFTDTIAQTTLSDFISLKDPKEPKVKTERKAKAKVETLVVDESIAIDVVASVVDDMLLPFEDDDFLETPVDLSKIRASVGLEKEVDTDDLPF
jgi:hypothetical protein